MTETTLYLNGADLQVEVERTPENWVVVRLTPRGGVSVEISLDYLENARDLGTALLAAGAE